MSNVHSLNIQDPNRKSLSELSKLYQDLTKNFSCFDVEKSNSVMTLIKKMELKSPKSALIALNLWVFQDAIFGLHAELKLAHKYRSHSTQAHTQYVRVFKEFRAAMGDYIRLLGTSL